MFVVCLFYIRWFIKTKNTQLFLYFKLNVLQWNEKGSCMKPPTVEFIISYSLFKIKTGLYTAIQNETFVSLLTANAEVHYGNGARTCVRAASKVVVA